MLNCANAIIGKFKMGKMWNFYVFLRKFFLKGKI